MLANHCLSKIIKPPKNNFLGCMISIFIFNAGIPPNESQVFNLPYKSNDFGTVKSQSRQEITSSVI